MNTSDATSKDEAGHKESYHHGGLREALIAAASAQIAEHGAENFSLADACRRAGVSTAAPYKHFRDRDDILEEVVLQGFRALEEKSLEAVQSQGAGSLEGIIAMGHAYVDFAVEQTGLFRLMFGQHPALREREHVIDTCGTCFGHVIEQARIYCEHQGLEGDAEEIAVRLWTFVHGAASLLIDRDYARVAPGIDVSAMIFRAAPGLLKP